MHRIDAIGHVANMFDPGDPLVPRNPTKLDHTIMNALQEEVAKTIEGAGLTLRASGAADLAAGYASQLLLAIEKLNPVKAACVIDGTAPAAPVLLAGVGVRNVASVSLEAAGGGAPKRYRVTFSSPIGTPIAAVVTPRDVPALGTTNVVMFPNIWRLTTTYVEFFVPAAVVYGPGPALDASPAVDSYAMFYDVVVIGTGA